MMAPFPGRAGVWASCLLWARRDDDQWGADLDEQNHQGRAVDRHENLVSHNFN